MHMKAPRWTQTVLEIWQSNEMRLLRPFIGLFWIPTRKSVLTWNSHHTLMTFQFVTDTQLHFSDILLIHCYFNHAISYLCRPPNDTTTLDIKTLNASVLMKAVAYVLWTDIHEILNWKMQLKCSCIDGHMTLALTSKIRKNGIYH